MEPSAKEFRVLHICDYSASYRGNFIDSLESIENFHKNIKNFYLFPSRVKGTSAQEWIEAMNCTNKVAYIQEKNIFKNFLLLARIKKIHKINRVVRHFSDGKIDVLVKFLFKGRNVIRFFHNACPFKKNPIKRNFINFIWHKNKLVGVSNAVTRGIRLSHPKIPACTILNAINFDRLDKQEHFVKTKGVSLLMMGWDHIGKGVDLAIKATQPLQEKYDITLHVVVGNNEAKIKELAHNILGENVDWIRYLPQTNNIGTYYRACDIFLSPSRQEAFGYANIEAVYCENSIVLSKVGGQAELDINGAYWFDSENIESFTQQLETAIIELNTPGKNIQKKKAKDQVQRNYSLQTWSNKLVDLFH